MRQLFAILVMLLAATASEAVTVHRALVIGLGAQQDPSWGRIHGDNDVRYVVKMLREWGYTDIVSLKNEEATKQAIVDAFNALADRCDIGDHVYIHYSGHGQLVTDVDGDESGRWTGWHSQWDESWVPYDAYMSSCEMDRGEKHLVDDELAVLLTAIRDKIGSRGNLVVIVDSCHSGDATCGGDDECVRGVDSKFVIPRDPSAPVCAPLPERWLTVSACRPYELSTEIKRLQIGKLTYALYSLTLSVLEKKNADIEKILVNFIKNYAGKLPQTPMVSGRR